MSCLYIIIYCNVLLCWRSCALVVKKSVGPPGFKCRRFDGLLELTFDYLCHLKSECTSCPLRSCNLYDGFCWTNIQRIRNRFAREAEAWPSSIWCTATCRRGRCSHGEWHWLGVHCTPPFPQIRTPATRQGQPKEGCLIQGVRVPTKHQYCRPSAETEGAHLVLVELLVFELVVVSVTRCVVSVAVCKRDLVHKRIDETGGIGQGVAEEQAGKNSQGGRCNLLHVS